MVKIFNSLRGSDPIAAALSNLGQQMFGDRTGSAIKQEQLYGLQRENTEIDNLGRRIATGGGAQSLTADPVTQGILLSSGYDPRKFGDVALLGGATEYGARDPRTQNLQVGTGQSYGNTAGAFDTKMDVERRGQDIASSDRRYGVDQNRAQQQAEFFEKPIEAITPGGAPGFMRQGELTTSTASPILSEADQRGTLLGQNFENLPDLNPMQREVLGANPSSSTPTPRNYVTPAGESVITYDGVTNAQTGDPLPPGGFIGTVEGGAGDVGLTNSTLGGLQQSNIALDKFMQVANMADSLTDDPALFGPQGFIRSKAQDLVQSLGGLEAAVGIRDQLANSTISSETGELLGPEATSALIPELYDPRLSEVQALWGILLYQGAAALAGQENRSVSDKDIGMMREILGDPQSLFASNLAMKTKLDVARRLVSGYRDVNQQYLGGGGDAGAAQPAPQGANRTSTGTMWRVVE